MVRIYIQITVVAAGSIIPVKVLGIFALIDEGEIDWKVVTLHQEEASKKKVSLKNPFVN